MADTATYESYLATGEKLISPFKGTSMMPLLKQGRDVFIVEGKGAGRCQKGDVVLYRRPPASYVLHRVVAVRETDYVILGDNCVRREYGITDGDILGVMTGYIRKGREHSITERPYRAYSFLWMHTEGLRVLYFRLRGFAARVYRRIFPKQK